MVQRHNGNIEVESVPGRGTCIRLIFPIRKNPAQAGRDTLSQGNNAHSLHILCIDDDEPIRQLLIDCLTDYHHRVITAASGSQGMELFRDAKQKGQHFDVVITDLGMPNMDGRQLAGAIKAESPHTPVIMMTGWGATMNADGVTTPEIDAVVAKPPQMQELNALLLRLAAAGKRPA